jgi:transcriptional regulator with XRE-family HTH domain
MEAKDYVLALKGKGFTQTQISEATGIPQPTISKIERGEVMDVMSRNYRALQAAHKKMKPKHVAALAVIGSAATEIGA